MGIVLAYGKSYCEAHFVRVVSVKPGIVKVIFKLDKLKSERLIVMKY
jgi:hypothetical protein